jgi:hypothetical protein
MRARIALRPWRTSSSSWRPSSAEILAKLEQGRILVLWSCPVLTDTFAKRIVPPGGGESRRLPG